MNYWRDKAEKLLVPEDRVRLRNERITSVYARLYLARRHLFKWAGMAAFASHRVGLALGFYRLLWDGYGEREWRREAEDTRDEGLIRDDLEHIRRTNNRVFADLAWMHLAYMHGGLSEVAANLAEGDERLEGFRLIDTAARRLEEGARPRDVSDAVWWGNALLLWHEQKETVQRAFDELDPGFDVFLSCFSYLDFDANRWRAALRVWSSFVAYMWLKGPRVLLKTFSFPDATRFDHRWYWVKNGLLPAWQRADETRARWSRIRRLTRGPALPPPAEVEGAHASEA